MNSGKTRIWAARGLIGFVFFFNIQCAFLFVVFPSRYCDGFGLNGITGEKIVQSFGILFLMWNIPYFFALMHPSKNALSLIEAIAMQATGLTGESLLVMSIPDDAIIVRETITRFITFDGVGLLLLLAAGWLVKLNMVKINGR